MLSDDVRLSGKELNSVLLVGLTDSCALGKTSDSLNTGEINSDEHKCSIEGSSLELLGRSCRATLARISKDEVLSDISFSVDGKALLCSFLNTSKQGDCF